MEITYGLAEYDRKTGSVEWNINLPMGDVQGGFLYEFLRDAGAKGWDLCAAFPSGTKGSRRALAGKAETEICEDPAEVITLIFKQI